MVHFPAGHMCQLAGRRGYVSEQVDNLVFDDTQVTTYAFLPNEKYRGSTFGNATTAETE
jgi:hypothetical protein